MQVAVGTFNLNNLFSRFNFRGQVTALPEQPPIEFTSTFELPEAMPEVEPEELDPLERGPALREYRTYKGRLVKGKNPKDTQRVAKRIRAISRAGTRSLGRNRARANAVVNARASFVSTGAVAAMLVATLPIPLKRSATWPSLLRVAIASRTIGANERFVPM